MSFIVITYGYNLYSIFNIESTTLPLIDNIIKSVFSNIRSTLSQKKEVFQGELQVLTNEEESLKKQITKLEQDKVKEEKNNLIIVNNTPIMAYPKGSCSQKGNQHAQYTPPAMIIIILRRAK